MAGFSLNKEEKNREKNLFQQLLKENPPLHQYLLNAKTAQEASDTFKTWILNNLDKDSPGYRFYIGDSHDRQSFEALNWTELAAIRILDYLDHEGRSFKDPAIRNEVVITKPFHRLWSELHDGEEHCSAAFYEDFIFLFRQYRGELKKYKPNNEELLKWMNRWPDGLDPRIIKMREENKDRIIRVFIEKMDNGNIKTDPKYHFEGDLSFDEKYNLVSKWWNNQLFHLKFALRNPDDLNDFLGGTLDARTMDSLHEARDKGIPFFVNPYYLSLLSVNAPDFAKGADQAIRDYVFFSDALIEEFGHIVAWEKEDEVEQGKPNAAGWLLPGSHNVHRRYPEVAILIPDTVGRACGGLCVSCQRMYDFQSGNLNFNLDKLRPRESWDDKLKRLLSYWEEDAQLRDILITGGDALMSSNRSLEKIFNALLEMVKRKRKANDERAEGQKYAELLRVRLGTRLPVYLPQRITPELTRILRDFKRKATKLGIKQFFIQTHFESPMEVTPEAKLGIERLIEAGWTVTNQMVFTAAASRRGHSAKLRKSLNEIGVVNYYTFSVKGYLENRYNFATNERAVQEQLEEKVLGRVPREYYKEIASFPEDAENLVERIKDLQTRAGLHFLGTDRNVLNLPGVGKSLTFRTIGITKSGRRILEFDYDKDRKHSPITKELGKVIIIESKSIRQYLEQLASYGEDITEYESIWGYSIGVTEPRNPMYDYPAYPFSTTSEYTNLGMS